MEASLLLVPLVALAQTPGVDVQCGFFDHFLAWFWGIFDKEKAAEYEYKLYLCTNNPEHLKKAYQHAQRCKNAVLKQFIAEEYNKIYGFQLYTCDLSQLFTAKANCDFLCGQWCSMNEPKLGITCIGSDVYCPITSGTCYRGMTVCVLDTICAYYIGDANADGWCCKCYYIR